LRSSVGDATGRCEVGRDSGIRDVVFGSAVPRDVVMRVQDWPRLHTFSKPRLQL
jgi:hypothetical protein